MSVDFFMGSTGVFFCSGNTVALFDAPGMFWWCHTTLFLPRPYLSCIIDLISDLFVSNVESFIRHYESTMNQA